VPGGSTPLEFLMAVTIIVIRAKASSVRIRVWNQLNEPPPFIGIDIWRINSHDCGAFFKLSHPSCRTAPLISEFTKNRPERLLYTAHEQH